MNKKSTFLRKNITGLFILIMLFVGLSAEAKANSLDNTATINEKSFITLATSYDSVKDKMIKDISENNGAIWYSWINEGIKSDGSLYWWLLATWLYENNQLQQAYAASVQALVITRLDLAICSGNPYALDEFSKKLMSRHSQLFGIKATQETIKQSILRSIAKVEKMHKENKHTSAQACYLYNYEKYKDEHKKDIKVKLSSKLTAELINQQKRELVAIKKDLSYDKVIDVATIDNIWISDQKIKNK